VRSAAIRAESASVFGMRIAALRPLLASRPI